MCESSFIGCGLYSRLLCSGEDARFEAARFPGSNWVQHRAVRRLSRREGIQLGAAGFGGFFAADLFIAEMGRLMSRKSHTSPSWGMCVVCSDSRSQGKVYLDWEQAWRKTSPGGNCWRQTATVSTLNQNVYMLTYFLSLLPSFWSYLSSLH